VLAVVKMRGSGHSTTLRRYEVTEHGLVLGEALTEYVGIVTGVARRRVDLPPAESVSGGPDTCN
jgi:circadian clock protein KaiC